MVVLHAFIKVDPAQREDFLQNVQDLLKYSKAEEGNNMYHLYEDASEPNTFVMLEEWKDMEALQFHGQTEHYQAFKVATESMLVEPTRAKIYEVSTKQ